MYFSEMASVSQEIDEFLSDPQLSVFEGFQKKHLLELGDRYELELRNSMVKKELQGYVMNMLIGDELFEANDVKDKFPPLVRDPKEIEKQIERREKEIERREKEIDRAREREREVAKEKDREIEREKIELEKNRLKFEEAEKDKQRQYEEKMWVREQEAKTRYVPGKYLVPNFMEDNVEGFFDAFEKVAQQAKWPEDQWSLIVQAKVKGKAQLVYAKMSASDSAQYSVFKKEVLKAYELVPEAYRQNFRGLRKSDNQTHLEFVHEKTVLFDRWCKAKAVTDLESLRQLVLLEEFKWKIHEAIRCHINERDCKTVDEAAKIADDFALTHKKLLNPPSKQNHRGQQRGFPSGNSGVKVTSTSGSSASKTPANSNAESQGQKSEVVCRYCKETGHTIPTCPALEQKRKKEQQGKGTYKPGGFVTVVGTLSGGNHGEITRKSRQPKPDCCRTVNHMSTGDSVTSTTPSAEDGPSTVSPRGNCNDDATEFKSSLLVTGICRDVYHNSDSGSANRVSHLVEENDPSTYLLGNHNDDTTGSSSGVASILGDSPLIASPHGKRKVDAIKSAGQCPALNPFESSGKISIGESPLVPIRIWRDTGACQSLLLASTFHGFPLPKTDDFVVCRGIGDGEISVPLHTVYLESNLVNGMVTVGLIPSLPHEGISLLLGNDLAGGKVMPPVRLTANPSLEQPYDEDVETYPSCAVTRSMARRKVHDDEHEMDVVDLSDTLFANLKEDEKNLCDVDETDPIIMRGVKEENPLSSSRQDLAQVDPPFVPWQSTPAFGDPFPRVIIDCAGPLLKTKSENQYVLNRKVDVRVEESDPDRGGKVYDTTLTPSPKLLKSETLARLTDKLQHLTTQQRLKLDHTLWAHEDVFLDAPPITRAAVHDVDVGDTKLIKTHACRRSPDKRILTDKEIAYMLWVINCSNGSQFISLPE